MKYDVIIIGAGLSGLTAAHRIKQTRPQSTSLILEASDRIGGRIVSVSLKTTQGYDDWDLGGQWIGKTQQAINALMGELGVDSYPQYIEGEHLVQEISGGEIKAYKGDDYPASATASADTWNIYRKLQNLMKEFASYPDPFAHKKFQEWNKISVGEFLKKQSWTQGGLDLMELLLKGVIDAKLHQVSLAHFLNVGKTAGGDLEAMIEDKGNGAQAYKIANGATSICQKLVEILPEKTILLNHVVRKIDQSGAGSVTIETNNGGKFECGQVIVAIPPCQVARIVFEPPLSEEKLNLMQNFYPKAEGCKFLISYDRAFWREAGYSGQIMAEADKSSSLPEIATYDAVNSNGAPALLGFSSIRPDVPLEERKRLHATVIAKFYGSHTPQPLDYVDKCWSAEPYELGCVASIAPGLMSHDFPRLIREPIGKVHWAGTETANQWMGYMNGAVDAGQRAANAVLNSI